MKTAKQAISLNEQPNTQAEALADLPVTDEQAEQAKGGQIEVLSFSWGMHQSGAFPNHNETSTCDEEEDAAFTELSLTDEELDGIKGGPLCHGVSALAWARVDGVSPLSNHNETLAEDATSAASLADLQVQADEQIKGGPNKVGTGVLTLNEANTYLGTTSIDFKKKNFTTK
jgi:autotransporter-associated beta strand protein